MGRGGDLSPLIEKVFPQEREQVFFEDSLAQLRISSWAIRCGDTLYAPQTVDSAKVESFSRGRHAGLLLIVCAVVPLVALWLVPILYARVFGYPDQSPPIFSSVIARLGVLLIVLGGLSLIFGKSKYVVVLETSSGRKELLRTPRADLAHQVVDGVLRAMLAREPGHTIFTGGGGVAIVGTALSSPITVHGAQAKRARRPDDREFAFPHHPRPTIELTIRDHRDAGQQALALIIVATDAAGKTERKTFPPISLRSDPRQLVEQWFKRLAAPGRSSTSKALELADLGAELGRQLLPAELARLLAAHAGAGRTLWLLAEEPHIPWELLRIPLVVEGEQKSRPYLCQDFAMSRWEEGREPQTELPLRKIGVLVPEEKGTIAAGDELAMLERLLGPGRELVKIEPRLDSVLAALGSGDFDAFHFCGHAHAPEGDPNLAGIPLAHWQWLTPMALAGNMGRFAERRPLVFLNGCHTGRAGFTLTDVGGWAAQFLAAGAGAFVGCAWAVNGPTALRVAEAFYQRFLAGDPFAEALRQARVHPGLPCPLTPWAYVAHGHPLARVGKE